MNDGLRADGTSSGPAGNNSVSLQDKKILLMYGSAGKGHETAIKAIAGALQDKGFDGKIEIVDSLKFMPRLVADLFSRGYLYVASKIPWLWYMMYENRASLSEFEPPPPYQDAFWKIILRKLQAFVKEEKPDYIVSAYFTSSWTAGRYKKLYDPTCRVATVVTDYGIHTVWLAPGQDRYFVATDEIKYEVANLAWYTAAIKENIEVVGIPIEKRFWTPKNKSELLDKYELDRDRFTILLLTAVYGNRHIEEVLLKLTECQSSIQVLLVAAKDFRVDQKIKDVLAAKGIPFREYGLIKFMEDLMAVADVAITKTGGLTSTECLVSGCPLFVYKPYPGQEERNSALFLEKGAAWRIFQIESLPLKVDILARNPEIHARMVKAARDLTRHPAAELIAQTVIDDLRKDHK